MVQRPVYINKNIYYNAPHFDKEKDYLSFEKVPHFSIIDENDAVYLEIDLDEEVLSMSTEIITTEKLEEPRIVGERFENPDGTEIILNKDLLGNIRKDSPVAGPLENLIGGYNKIQIWTKGLQQMAGMQ